MQFKYGLPNLIFGEDLDTPKMIPFLSGRIAKKGDRMGWEYWYHCYGKKDLESVEGTVEWQPKYLDEIQFRVMFYLCEEGELDFAKEPQIEKDAQEFGYLTIDDLVKSLCDTGVVAKIGPNKIRLLTQDCQVMMLDDKYIMGESSDRLNNWLIKHSEEVMPWMKKK